jgi:hypothetical protein
MIRKIFYALFKRYKRLELRCFTYAEGDKLLRANNGKPEDQQWVLAKEEDTNRKYGMVYLQRRVRITK